MFFSKREKFTSGTVPNTLKGLFSRLRSGKFTNLPIWALEYNNDPIGLRFFTDKGVFDVTREAFAVFEVADFRVVQMLNFNGALLTQDEFDSGNRVLDVTKDKDKVRALFFWLTDLVGAESKSSGGLLLGSHLKLRKIW